MKGLFHRLNARRQKPIDAVAEIDAEQAAFPERFGHPDLDDGVKALAPGAKGFLGLLTLTALLLVGLFIMRWINTSGHVKEESNRLLQAKIENVLPDLKLQRPDPPKPVTTPEPTAPVVPDLAHPVLPGRQRAKGLLMDPLEKRRLTPGLQGERNPSSQTASAPAASAGASAESGPMAERLRPLRLNTAHASRLGNRDLLLTQGAMIDCVQQTKFVSAQAGMVTCYATREVRSANGRVVLIDPGTIFVGYQQSVISQGQPRIGIVWSRLETPEGVVVNLDSPGTGALGEAGLDGEIDTHFADRFGAAIMVSLIDDVGNWLSNQNRNSGNGQISFDGSRDAAQQAVATVLNNTINIPPTLYRNQGGRIGIYVARDLDFSSVYELRPTHAVAP